MTEFSPDGKRLITTQANGHVKIWNTSSWVMEDDLALTDGEVRAAAFAPDGKTLVTTHLGKGQGLYGGTMRIWDTSTWMATIKPGYSCAAYSKDGKILALGRGNLRLVDLVSGEQTQTIKLPEMTLGESAPGMEKRADADKNIPVQITALAFSPNGGTLAVGTKGPLRLVQMKPLETSKKKAIEAYMDALEAGSDAAEIEKLETAAVQNQFLMFPCHHDFRSRWRKLDADRQPDTEERRRMFGYSRL